MFVAEEKRLWCLKCCGVVSQELDTLNIQTYNDANITFTSTTVGYREEHRRQSKITMGMLYTNIFAIHPNRVVRT
jgi:hypothetical protein